MNQKQLKHTTKKEAIKRILSKIHVTSTCWNWTGYISKEGYGYFSVNHQNVGTHRFTYELYYGKIPKGMFIDHLCKNRKCCNPLHLETVTPLENLKRGDMWKWNTKKTHCKRGHLLSGNNVLLKKGNKARRCRRCSYLQLKNWRKNKK